jgi:hypothetical protein
MGPACAATIKVTGTRSVNIDFTVGTMNEAAGDYPWVGVAGYFSAGTLGGVTHIDVVYETAGPWRTACRTKADMIGFGQRLAAPV